MPEIIPCETFDPAKIEIIPPEPELSGPETDVYTSVWNLERALKPCPVSGSIGSKPCRAVMFSVKENGHALRIFWDAGGYEASTLIPARVVGKAQHFVKLNASLILPFLRHAEADKGMVLRFFSDHKTIFENGKNYQYVMMQIVENTSTFAYLKSENAMLRRKLAEAEGCNGKV